MRHAVLWTVNILLLFVLEAAARGQTPPNTLSAEEMQEGWILLWDGKTLNGWESHGGGVWKVDNGALVGEPEGKPGWLGTTRAFSDFVLKAEFRTTADCNSGIYLRAAREGVPRQTGYELQIRDYKEPQETVPFLTGSLVMHAHASGAKIIPNQWNRYEVTAQGDHFIVVYNGQTVLDTRQSKTSSGVIGLEYNNRKIEFRNLKLRPLR